MTEPPPDTAAHLRDLLARRAPRRGPADAGEEGGTSVGATPAPDDVADRVRDTLKRMREEAPDEVGDPREFQAALDTLLREGRRATAALRAPGRLDPGDLMALEAVIATDGTRPSLLIRDNTFRLDHPLVGEWQNRLDAIHVAMTSIAQSVGRIEPAVPSAQNFFGTGWVVDTENRLVLTNMHVLEEIWTALPHVVTPTDGGFQIHGGVYIDFAVESGRDTSKRFRVVHAVPTTVDGAMHMRFDAAVLRIEPTDGSAVPEQIPVVPDINTPRGNGGDVFLVGCPGRPKIYGKTSDNKDWAWVYQSLFGNVFGVKRFAPGGVHRPIGSLPTNPREWVFGHDATTLGGSSGSPVITLAEGAAVAVGLHYAGASESTNYAHAFSRATTELSALQIPLAATESAAGGERR